MKKFISLTICLSMLLTAFPVFSADATSIYSNAEIVTEVARAYDRQGGQIHYDQLNTRRHLSVSPEEATAQKTIYLDCSSYVNSCYREAFGVNVMPYEIPEKSPSTANYESYAKENQQNPDVIGFWENADYTTEEEIKEVVDFVVSQLQVGDIFSFRRDKSGKFSGHVYIYIGNNTFMHCYGGSSYSVNKENPALSADKDETEQKAGIIGEISVDDIFYNKTHTRYIFKNTKSERVSSFCLLRPFARNLTPTEEALNRMKIAGLSAEKLSSVYETSSIYTEDVITYSIIMENTNNSILENVIITDTIPGGTKFVSGSSNVKVNGSSLEWTGDIPANSVVTVTYDVAVTETKAGALIESNSTYVSGVKLGDITHTVSGFRKSHTALVEEIAREYADTSKEFDNPLNLAKEVYKSALGIDLFNCENVGEVLENIIDIPNLTCRTDTEIYKMLVPNLYGGTTIHLGQSRKVDSKRERLISEGELSVGDIILADWSGGSVVYIYAGNKTLITVQDGVCKSLTIGNNIYAPDADNILVSLYGYERYAVLRPSMLDIKPAADVKSITVKPLLNKLTYNNGEKFKKENVVVTANLSNGTKKEVKCYTVSPDPLTYPLNSVTINYGDVSEKVNITVAEEYKNVSVSEVFALEEDNIVRVEGIYVGTAGVGPQIYEEMLIKDTQEDTIIAVRGVPYGEFPDYGYNAGDKISLLVAVKLCDDIYNPNKKYLEFSSENASIESTVIEKGSNATYKLDNVTQISSWDDMKSFFVKTELKPYTYLKFTGTSYLNYYAGNDVYRLHKNPETTGLAHIRPDGARAVAIGKSIMINNIGEGSEKLLIDEEPSGYLGTEFEKTFYAVFVGTNQTHYQIVILDDSWVESSNDEQTASDYAQLSGDNKTLSIDVPCAGNYTVIFLDYENGWLVNSDSKAFVADKEGKVTVTMDKEMTVSSEDKVLLWNTTKGNNWYYKAFAIKKSQ